MSASASKIRTPPGVARSAAKRFDPDDSFISPDFKKILSTPHSAGSYGCQREVYHPLSPNAEPSALLFYDSDDDDPEEEGLQTQTPSRPNFKGKGKVSMPTNIAAHVGPTYDSPKSVVQSPAHLTDSKKRSSHLSRSSLSAIPVIPSPSTKKRSSGDPSSPTKRTRNTTENIFAGRILDYGSANGGSDSTSESDPDAEKLSSSLPGSFSADSFRPSEEPKESSTETHDVLPQTPIEAKDLKQKMDEPPILETPHRNRSLSTTPRRMPLPDSPGDLSEVGSLEGSPVSSGSPAQDQFSPAMARRRKKNASAIHTAELTERLQILNIKAQEYSEAISYTPADRELARELEKIFTCPDRFDPMQAKVMEDNWQEKIRRVVVAEEKRQHDLRVAEQARIEQERRAREAEAARIVAEERRRREEEERRRRQQDEEDRRRRTEEEARLRAEQQKAEEERRRLANERARQENEARQKAEQAKLSAQNQAQQYAQRNVQQSVSQSSQNQAAIPGRISRDQENVAIDRILANLKEVRKFAQDTPGFMKQNALSGIIREIRPKVSQLTGDKTQTLTSREFLKNTFFKLFNDEGPKRKASDFMLYPGPEQENALIPIVFIYVLNELAKIITKQVSQEGGAKAKSADPLGVVISSSFADPKFLVNGKSFVDVFIARIFKQCPPLRGELGPETTEADKYRLGWERFTETGMWEGLEVYCNRMRGLTSGFVSIAGRDFGNSKLNNPYPMYNLWYRIAYMLNAPTEGLTEAHYECMKTIIVTAGEKMFKVYGPQAKKLIELATGEWAEAGISTAPSGATAVRALGRTLQEETWFSGVQIR